MPRRASGAAGKGDEEIFKRETGGRSRRLVDMMQTTKLSTFGPATHMR